MAVDRSKVQSIARFVPPKSSGTWPCTNCGEWHESSQSWVVRMSHDGDEWSVIVCPQCAHELAPPV